MLNKEVPFQHARKWQCQVLTNIISFVYNKLKLEVWRKAKLTLNQAKELILVYKKIIVRIKN